MEGNYKHRVVDALLERKLLGKGAVLVEGAKFSHLCCLCYRPEALGEEEE